MSRTHDRRLAELLGWTIYHYDKDIKPNCYYMLMTPEWTPAVLGWHDGERWTEAEAWDDCPHYSSSIADAYAMETVLQQRGLATQYTRALMEILADTYGPDWSDFHVVHATPEQRAAAAIVVLEAQTNERT